MKTKREKILLILLIAFFANCNKKDDASGTPGAPTIEKVVFNGQSNASVHIKSDADNFEINMKDQNGNEIIKSGSGSPISINTPFGEVLEIKARVSNGSSEKSEYSGTVEVLASANLDKGLNRVELMKAINKMRVEGADCGGTMMPAVPKLVWDDRVEALTLSHSADMYKNNLTGGTSSDGKTYKERIEAAGLTCQQYQELIYKAPTLDLVLNFFKASSSHCKVMMSGKYTLIGGANDHNNWVFDFTE